MSARRHSRLLLAIILAANGIAALAVPDIWYARIPGVIDTGPLNRHFIRDIGAAYLVAGLAFAWLRRDARAWPAALAGSAFLALHALVHTGEMLAGTIDAHHLLRDLPGVFLLPVFALWLAWPHHLSTKEKHHAEMDRAASARRL
ncbi:MAG TPA: hypothetical protein VGE12_08045 [Noviherbaspirillum sp.]